LPSEITSSPDLPPSRTLDTEASLEFAAAVCERRAAVLEAEAHELALTQHGGWVGKHDSANLLAEAAKRLRERMAP
jgi:hypothetical protein